jgi:hypothetical protein
MQNNGINIHPDKKNELIDVIADKINGRLDDDWEEIADN